MADHNKQYKELDLQKMRVEFLGFAFTGVPINTDHADYIVDKAGATGDESTTKPESTPGPTTSTQPEAPLHSNAAQPDECKPHTGLEMCNGDGVSIKPPSQTAHAKALL